MCSRAGRNAIRCGGPKATVGNRGVFGLLFGAGLLTPPSWLSGLLTSGSLPVRQCCNSPSGGRETEGENRRGRRPAPNKLFEFHFVTDFNASAFVTGIWNSSRCTADSPPITGMITDSDE